MGFLTKCLVCIRLRNCSSWTLFLFIRPFFMRFDIKPKWEVIHIPETLFIWMNYDSTNKWVKTQFLNTFRIKANWHLYFSLRRNRLQEKQDTSMTKIHIYPFKNLSELLRCILPNGGMSSAAVPTAHISWTLWNLLWVLLGTESTNPKKLRVPTLLPLGNSDMYCTGEGCFDFSGVFTCRVEIRRREYWNYFCFWWCWILIENGIHEEEKWNRDEEWFRTWKEWKCK